MQIKKEKRRKKKKKEERVGRKEKIGALYYVLHDGHEDTFDADQGGVKQVLLDGAEPSQGGGKGGKGRVGYEKVGNERKENKREKKNERVRFFDHLNKRQSS